MAPRSHTSDQPMSIWGCCRTYVAAGFRNSFTFGGVRFGL